MRRLFISFLVLFVWVKTFSQTDSKEIQNKVDLFDKYIQSSMPLWKTTGLSVAVVKDGKVIFKKGMALLILINHNRLPLLQFLFVLLLLKP